MEALVQRVLAFDATPLIQRGMASGVLKPTVRFQAYAYVPDLFTQEPGHCTCGCGLPLTGRRRRWATDDCAWFGLAVLRIIKCDADVIRHYLIHQHGEGCAHCGLVGEPLQVDHILPVHKGGGGRWLDNYNLLCKSCHREKTNRELKELRIIKKRQNNGNPIHLQGNQ